ncbi:MAG TPA: PKD domain-containing protein [Thermoplasmata archaeon]|nr:PKD domain-containing protein [Thermoplasmata archaeon]
MKPIAEFRSVGYAITVALLLSLPAGLALPSDATGAAPLSAAGSGGACLGAAPSGSVHDLSVFAANLTEFAGTGVEMFATLPNGSAAATYSWQTGDGSVIASTVGALRHIYSTPGLYAVCVQAVDAAGVIHDNRGQLLLISVSASAASDPRGTVPLVSGTLLSNSTSRTAPTAFLAPGGSAVVGVTVDLPSQQPATLLGTPTFALSPNAGPNLTLTALSLSTGGTSRARVVVSTSAASGFYTLNFSLPATTPSNGTTLHTWANYTFTIVVGTQLGGSALPQAGPPVRNRITVVEVQSAPPTSLDPAFVTATATTELLTNIYQTLVAPNGSEVGGRAGAFVPELATCVPGSSLCRSLYGRSLVSGQNYTFVIDPAARFYDPATGASWGVWPTDVLFSLVRSMAFANDQCFGCSGASALAQALLPPGNWSWDGAVHGALNDTPAWMYAALELNATGLCPLSALARGGHGCLTIRLPSAPSLTSAHRSLLELLAAPEAASVEPCGWFSAAARGAGVPYWTAGNVSGSGDRPCAAPGSPGAGVPPTSLVSTAFDAWELGVVAPVPAGVIGLAAAGSGPFALSSIGTFGYNLSASPVYAPDPACDFHGCAPAAGTFTPAVNVSWVPTGPQVQSAVENGSADVAIFGGGASASLVADASLGLLVPRLVPTLALEVDPFNLEYNRTAALPVAGVNLTAPSTFLSDLNLRQFLVHAYPYDASALLYAAGGPPIRAPGGGAIAAGSGVAVPRNVSWSTGGSVTNASRVGGAAWWWSRAAADPAVSNACSRTRPCSFLVAYPAGDAVTGVVDRSWAAAVASISNGSVLPVVHNENYSQLALGALYSAPGGQGPAVASGLTVQAVTADPAGPTNALYGLDSPIPYSDALGPILGGFNASGCSTSPTFWSSQSVPVPLVCQGAAYDAMLSALQAAVAGPLGPTAILLYDEAEQIANDLALYVYTGQAIRPIGLSPSVDPTSLSRSPLDVGLQGFDWDTLRWLASAASPLALRGLAPSPGASVGLNLTLTALATGGTGGYGYNWSGLPPGCATANLTALTCVPNSSGSYRVTLRVRETSGPTVSASVWVIVRDRWYRRRASDVHVRTLRGRPSD